ncbi:hypothetical protein SLE2022_159100 [Rubroshorea leprosula]
MTSNIASRLCQNPVRLQYSNLLSALESCKQTLEISQIHSFIVKTGLDRDPFTLSKLLASSIQDTQHAASIFNQIQHPNLFMYNTMLRAYSISDDPKQSFDIFNKLRARGIILDQFSFVTILKACARASAIVMGQAVHGVAVRSGHVQFINVKNTLLHFYGVCGRIQHAQKLFDENPQINDLVSWNSLMGVYLHISQPKVVIYLFRQMCRCCLRISVTTMLTVLPAASDLDDSLGGESLHGHCIKIGFCSDSKVLSALVDMYAKTGNIDTGRRIFDSVAVKDVVLWNCMIGNYAKSGLLKESIALLQLMEYEQVEPNSSTLVSLLSACAASGATNVGQCISNYVEGYGLPSDVVLGTALLDMFAKCGLLDKAIDIFQRMETKDVKSWTAMISAYGVHGRARDAISVFHRMEEEGFKPNEVTFLAVLSACSHGGLVMEGMKCFKRMVQKYGISPRIEHYGCVIDLFGRAGLLEEAYSLIESLPIKGDATAWRALLSACRVHGNVRLGERVERVLVGFDDGHPTDSILLSSTYAIAGWSRDRVRMQETKEEITEFGNGSADKHVEMIKEAGYSTIEMESVEFEQGL